MLAVLGGCRLVLGRASVRRGVGGAWCAVGMQPESCFGLGGLEVDSWGGDGGDGGLGEGGVGCCVGKGVGVGVGGGRYLQTCSPT